MASLAASSRASSRPGVRVLLRLFRVGRRRAVARLLLARADVVRRRLAVGARRLGHRLVLVVGVALAVVVVAAPEPLVDGLGLVPRVAQLPVHFLALVINVVAPVVPSVVVVVLLAPLAVEGALHLHALVLLLAPQLLLLAVVVALVLLPRLVLEPEQLLLVVDLVADVLRLAHVALAHARAVAVFRAPRVLGPVVVRLLAEAAREERPDDATTHVAQLGQGPVPPRVLAPRRHRRVATGHDHAQRGDRQGHVRRRCRRPGQRLERVGQST